MNLGFSIKDIRNRRGLSQAALAQQCETTQEYISNLERGKQTPSKEMLDKISDVLNVPAEVIYLFSLDGENVPEDKKSLYESIVPQFKEALEELFELKD
ncbi:MAG: helix-turn-helix transcriptional regulator [Bacteroidia bacterium]|nr:helix-turn-helix transcriptional regulator [Bacteroidia bacterium]